MSDPASPEPTDEELVSMLVETGIQSAKRPISIKRHNELQRHAGKLSKQLVARGEGALRKLLPEVDHPDAYVRYYAATSCDALDSKRCRAVLEQLTKLIGPTTSHPSICAMLYLLDVDKDFLQRHQASNPTS